MAALPGSEKTCVWYGSRREAKGYDRRTEEYVVFHYNYEHEEDVRQPGHAVFMPTSISSLTLACGSRAAQIPNALVKKSSDEVRALLDVRRLAWTYYPFDFNAALPCGTPGGGNCPTTV